MKTYNILGLLALLVIVAALPMYATRESSRMEQAQVTMRQQRVRDAADLYVENCAFCHGANGEGLAAMPALNNAGLASAEPEMLYNVIARSTHGSNMAAWHVEEGGILNTYEVEGLATLISSAEWGLVSDLVASRAIVFSEPVIAEPNLVSMEGATEDPHECRACHEEPAVHADRFGLNCARCHTLEAWKPALLTRHTFELDHGSEGKLACETCHTTTYAENTCYGCHDHTEEQMETVHLEQDIVDIRQLCRLPPDGPARRRRPDARQRHAAAAARWVSCW